MLCIVKECHQYWHNISNNYTYKTFSYFVNLSFTADVFVDNIHIHSLCWRIIFCIYFGTEFYHGTCIYTFWCWINTSSSLLLDRLTHLPLEKMAAILADDIFKHIFLNENIRIVIQISLNVVPMGLIDNTPALVQVMAWRRTGDKPLPEAMMTQFANVCMWH